MDYVQLIHARESSILEARTHSDDRARSDTLNSASETLSNGCSAEISDGNALISGANTIIEQYPVRPFFFFYLGVLKIV